MNAVCSSEGEAEWEAEGEVEEALGREGTWVMVPLNSNSSKNLADTFFLI